MWFLSILATNLEALTEEDDEVSFDNTASEVFMVRVLVALYWFK